MLELLHTNVMAEDKDLKIGIVISPPRQYFRESKVFLKHRHGHWNTIASQYCHLGSYCTGSGPFKLTRTCLSSLAKNACIVNENARCLCWNNNEALNPKWKPQLFCGLPRELVMTNVLIPYHKPFDNKRNYDMVFHGWTRSDKPSIASRLCVRIQSQSMLSGEGNCSDYDMKCIASYTTKARDKGLLHHVMVQDMFRSTKLAQMQKKYNDSSSNERLESKRLKTSKRKRTTNSMWGNAPALHTATHHLPFMVKTEKEEMERRLRFGHIYKAYASFPKSGSTIDRWDNGYWRVEAQRMGNLPRWSSSYTTHVPIEFPGLPSLMRFDMETNKLDTVKLASLFENIKNAVNPFMAYNNKTVLPESYRLCFAGVPVENYENLKSKKLPVKQQYDPSLRLCSLRLPVLLPPVLQEAGAETYRRSVLYDHAMHMVVAEGDTVWTGNVRYKPMLSSYFNLADWKDTPLVEVKLKPGVYRWTAFRLGMDTTYSEINHVQKFIAGCSDCVKLFGQSEYASTMIKNDHNPHYYLINKTITAFHRLNRQEVFEKVTNVHEKFDNFDRLIHIWASDSEEFENCGVDMPLNWWNKVNKYLNPIKMCWPLARMLMPFVLEVPIINEFKPESTPSQMNQVELKHQLLGAATKLVIKNPASFFNRQLISVEICSGGPKAGGYTLLDENSLEVVGAILLDQCGNDRQIYECHRNSEYQSSDINKKDPCLYTDNQTSKPAVGVHFVPYSFQTALEKYGDLTKHLATKHDTAKKRRNSETRRSRIEDCFANGMAASFTPHDFNFRPRDVVNTNSIMTAYRPIADVKDKCLGPLQVYVVMDCDPYDRHWYGKVEGTPRSKLSDSLNRNS